MRNGCGMIQNNQKKPGFLDSLLRIQPVVWVLIVMLVFFSILAPSFLSIENALSLARQGAILVILCMGVIVIKITGGMDLSNGAIMTLAGMIMAWAMVKMNISVPIACLMAVITAVLFGFLNGFLVSILKIPSFITTLGTQGIAVGLALGINNGNVIGNLPKTISVIGESDVLGIPLPLIITAIVFALSFNILNNTKFGMYIYAIGGNEEALKLTGQPVLLYKILAYAYSGFTAGIAALILTSRNMAAQPTVGLGMEFQAFAGVVLGGSFMAGRGTAIGALIGSLVIIILRNGLNLIGIPTYLQMAIFGSVLISAIVISTLVEQKTQKLVEG